MIQINQNQKRKIPDVSNLPKKSDYNTKVSEIEGKIQSITGLATTSALTAIENEIKQYITLNKTKYLVNENEKPF